MANVKFPRAEFEKYIKITPEIEEKISLFGTPVESLTNREIEIEVFPNRPDLLSMHGFLRAFQAFIGKGRKKYKLNKPEKDYTVTIDKSTLEVRPYTACAIVRGLKLDDEKIKEVIDLQEKIHGTYGRNRKKIAIGVYPLDKITLPIKLEARDPDDIKFKPLESQKEMTGKQILSSHPTGREYGNLLKNFDKYPVFVDAAGEILSMPPIINSEKTGKISKDTQDIFLECSGSDFPSLSKTLNILVTMFSDMGGNIYQMNLKHPKGSKITPDLDPQETHIKVDNVNKLLGLELTEKQISNYLEKMGHEYSRGTVLSPAWRTDILHENDLIEDVAIAYGYQNFDPLIPEISFEGSEDPKEVKKRKIAEILIGLRMLETSSYHLTTVQDQFKAMGIKSQEKVEVEDSKTDYKILRSNLLHILLRILKENTDAEYPQKIFEMGTIFGDEESESLAIALAGKKSNFTEIKQVLDYLMKMIDLEYHLLAKDNQAFIEGRCGEIKVGDKTIGYIGEVKPSILANNKLKMPVAALEMNLDEIL